MIQAFDFFIHNVNRDSAAERQGRHAGHRRIQIAEVSLPRGTRREREFEKPLSGLFAESDAVACLLSDLVEFKLQVGLDVLGTRPEPRQRERPKVDAGQQVFAEATLSHGSEQVAVRSCNQLKIAVALAIRSKRKKRLFFERAEQHSLLVRSKLANFVEKQYTGVSGSEQTGAIFQCSGESAFCVTEESR